MDILLRLECEECRMSFIVRDLDVDKESLTCPYCEAEVPVPDAEDECEWRRDNVPPGRLKS